MENSLKLDDLKYDLTDENAGLPDNEKRRISSSIKPKDFLQKMATKQVPCPWGKVDQIDTKKDPRFRPLFQNVPIGLVLGCGTNTYSEGSHAVIARAIGFGMIIHSDRNPPHERPHAPNYIQMDLTVRETIHLFEMQVHAVMSCSVFTEDEFGFSFVRDEYQSVIVQKPF